MDLPSGLVGLNTHLVLSAVSAQARIAKLLVKLKHRLTPFEIGEQEAFRDVQTINAEQLATASFGEVMLHTVGRVYASEANIHAGNIFEVGITKIRRTGTNLK